MTMDCQQQFDSIIATYAGMPLYLPEVTTEQNCSEVIPAALDDTTGANCPVQQVLLGCFQVSPRSNHACVYHTPDDSNLLQGDPMPVLVLSGWFMTSVRHQQGTRQKC